MRMNSGFIHSEEDSRDYKISKTDIPKLKKGTILPNFVDLSSHFTPVEDQESIGSCTAQAVVGLCEYLTKLHQNKYIELSRLFLYKVTRNLMKLTGDTGASIKAAMHTARIVGICPEKYWLYNTELFDEEPTAFCYSLAGAYKVGLTYYKVEADDELLLSIKNLISSNNPVVLGCKVFDGYFNSSGNITLPEDTSIVDYGWHAIVLVGYDEAKKSFKFRNSWGSTWGKDGYGWLPYSYIGDHTSDHWTATAMSFVDISEV